MRLSVVTRTGIAPLAPDLDLNNAVRAADHHEHRQRDYHEHRKSAGDRRFSLGFTLRVYTHLLPSGADRARRAVEAAFADEQDVPGMSQGGETGL